MSVRCKVRLVSVTQRQHNTYYNNKVETSVVHDAEFAFVSAGDGPYNSPENKRFWDATPSGKFSVCTTKGIDEWEIGKEYYVDVVPAPSSAP